MNVYSVSMTSYTVQLHPWTPAVYITSLEPFVPASATVMHCIPRAAHPLCLLLCGLHFMFVFSLHPLPHSPQLLLDLVPIPALHCLLPVVSWVILCAAMHVDNCRMRHGLQHHKPPFNQPSTVCCRKSVLKLTFMYYKHRL